MEIAMAFFDLIPVIAFLLGGILLQRDLYNKMSKGAFAVFSTGTILVFISGLFKAIHKIIYYVFNRDYYKLQASFFPIMATGFILSGVGLLALLVHKQGKESKVASFSLPTMALGLYFILSDEVIQESGTMIFVTFMVIGVAILDTCLGIISFKLKSGWIIVVIALSFIFTLGMGYLSSREDISDWIKEIVNVVAQGSFFVSALLLRKNGLGKEDSLVGLTK